MKALCVDASYITDPSGKDLLIVGNIYEIKEIIDKPTMFQNAYYVICETGDLVPFKKSRFVLLRDLNLKKLEL